MVTMLSPSKTPSRALRERGVGGARRGRVPAQPARAEQATSRPAAVEVDPELWKRYLSSRSTEAFNALVTAYEPYVRGVAARVARRLPPSVDPDDLTSAGSFGLMDAVSGFDPSRGVKFQTFALKRIVGAMNDSLRASDIAPRLARRREAAVKRARDDFRKASGRSPTEEELLRLLHADGGEARAILAGSAIPMIGSISAPGEDGDGGGGNGSGWIGRSEQTISLPDHRARQESPPLPAQGRELQRWLGRELSRSECLIIWLYYFESLNMKQIGQVLGICEGRVSQIHALLLERLRARVVREREGE